MLLLGPLEGEGRRWFWPERPKCPWRGVGCEVRHSFFGSSALDTGNREGGAEEGLEEEAGEAGARAAFTLVPGVQRCRPLWPPCTGGLLKRECRSLRGGSAAGLGILLEAGPGPPLEAGGAEPGAERLGSGGADLGGGGFGGFFHHSRLAAFEGVGGTPPPALAAALAEGEEVGKGLFGFPERGGGRAGGGRVENRREASDSRGEGGM